MSCKPTNTATHTFNSFLGPPIRHLELQYVPSTTYTVTQLNNTPTTASIATHTFSSSIEPPTPPLRPSLRSWNHQHWLSDHQCIPKTTSTTNKTYSTRLRLQTLSLKPRTPIHHSTSAQTTRTSLGPNIHRVRKISATTQTYTALIGPQKHRTSSTTLGPSHWQL